MVLVTSALVIRLICMPSALGPAALRLRAYISGKSLAPMLQLLQRSVIQSDMELDHNCLSVTSLYVLGRSVRD